MRPISVLTSSVLLLATLLALPAPAQAVSAERYAAAAHASTNQVRASRDRVRLAENRCLTRLANRQAHRTAARGEIYHQDLGTVLRRCGLSSTGENVASGFRSGRSVVRAGWMRSPGHRENILRREYRQMGIGATRGRNGTWYVAQLFGRRA